MRLFSKIPDKIVVHCSATDDGAGMDLLAIKRYHVDVLGWDDIGYHFVLENVGNGLFMMEKGRPIAFEGAHCKAKGRNRDSIGVCIVGDFDNRPPDPVLFTDAANFVALLCFVFDIPADNVSGHRDWEPAKTCPGKQFDLVKFRALVADFLSRFKNPGLGGQFNGKP